MQGPPTQPEPAKPSFWPQNVASLIIAILCLLVLGAILFPINIGRHRNNSLANSISKVKQLGVAVQIYASDYDERLPIAGQWVDLLGPYTKNENLFRSPEVVKQDPTAYGIAFRNSYSAKPLNDFDEPDRQVMLFDSTILSRNANSGLETLPNPGRHKSGPERGNIFGFADTHVKVFPDKILREPTADGKPLIK